MLENNRIEYKRELNDRFERSVVSFLNYAGGGEIVLGIDNSGEVTGISNPDTVQLKIVDRIKNNIKPQTLGLFDVVLEKIDDKDVIRVIVSAGRQRPYYIRKFGMTEQGCFIRVGSSSQHMSEQMIEDLLAKRQQITLQIMTSPRQNLTFKQLRIYYEEKSLKPTEQFIESLDLRQSSGEFNYAAYLLADQNGVSIKVAVYAGTDKVDLLETREYGNCCLITATQRLLDRLDSENRTFAKITSKKRLERERVNTVALREAVINAIVHNDYVKGFPLVEFFSDRVVVTSCGGLVEGLSEVDFFKCRSMPRNRELMCVFRDMELVEQIGSGLSRILKVYDRSVFEFTQSFTVVTFPFEEAFILLNEKINGAIKSVLDVIKEYPDVTIPQLVELTDRPKITIYRELKKHQANGQLHREGSRKKGRWVIDDIK
ncbi:MAG: putative DNA binding domain-containing protein [Nitrososphaerota archaeon]|jgi:predicted HTH transcriptional regulator|nr:putative DNA binding domain-containing protein [Nitrososphaerota archaeon]